MILYLLINEVKHDTKDWKKDPKPIQFGDKSSVYFFMAIYLNVEENDAVLHVFPKAYHGMKGGGRNMGLAPSVKKMQA